MHDVNGGARILGDLEEGLGTLLQIADHEAFIVAVFAWGEISLPRDLKNQLGNLISKKIAILRLDGRYYLRCLE
jgi:hypothetical protein